jgi:hypothetical protein
MIMRTRLANFGNWLGRHQRAIRGIQWFVILFYAFLIIIPTWLPLPDDTAALFTNMTVFAQFMFWGIWWPFVLLSIIFFGRLWCGVLCPEGSLSEFANHFGMKRAIPKWIKWGGWPFVSFLLTTLYGQMTSVYQYPKPVLLVLGGSTVAAIIVGLIYGKSSRIWCKYLCPVTGVFALLARLAPFRFKPDKEKWHNFQSEKDKKIIPIHCPTVLPLRTMSGASDCLMCGKCSNHREAIELTWRSPNEEIIVYGKTNQSIWASLLVIYGLCGVALAAFQWTNSFWLNHMRDVVESWLLTHNMMGAFESAPWWIFTNYPAEHDVFTWIFGLELVVYILGIGFLIGSLIFLLISLATYLINRSYDIKIFNHLSLSLIPLGGCSVFIGLFALTVTLLQKYANLGIIWINQFKGILLILVTIWSIYLVYQIIKQYTNSLLRGIAGFILMLAVYAIVNYSWILVLHIWVLKSDSTSWNTLWIRFF